MIGGVDGCGEEKDGARETVCCVMPRRRGRDKEPTSVVSSVKWECQKQ